MVRLNRTQMDYPERFQRMINDYNSGSTNVEGFFDRLTSFARSLTQEQQRAVSAQLSKEELALFDLLTKTEMEVTGTERAQVKKTARQLIATLKHEKLVLDWRKRQKAPTSKRVTIETVLDQGLARAYSPGVTTVILASELRGGKEWSAARYGSAADGSTAASKSRRRACFDQVA